MDFYALASTCAPHVHPTTMAAIVKTESSFRPLAININGKAKLSRQPASIEEAVVTARWLIESGYNIDLGLGQINSKNLPKLGLRIEDAFDPCTNLAAAAKILKDNFAVAKTQTGDDQAALRAALSAYNTGSYSRGIHNGYVQRVTLNVRSGSPSMSGNTPRQNPQ